jgi:hypothetical protein
VLTGQHSYEGRLGGYDALCGVRCRGEASLTMYVCMLQHLSWIASDLEVSKGKGLVLSNSPYDQSCPGLGCRKALVAMVT